jgi:IS5 family transposase
MQLTFGDAEGMGKRKKTRREIFLAEMERVVPWAGLLALIEPHYPTMGRPAASRTRWRRCCASISCSSGTR